MALLMELVEGGFLGKRGLSRSTGQFRRGAEFGDQRCNCAALGGSSLLGPAMRRMCYSVGVVDVSCCKRLLFLFVDKWTSR